MKNDSLQIRMAHAGDLDEIQICARAAYLKYVVRMNQDPAPMHADFASQIAQGHVHVAQSGPIIAGYVVFHQEEDHICLENVAVLPALAGNGIGKRLIQYAERAAQQLSLTAIELYTNEAMTENLAMYPKLGYVETERKRQAGFSRVFFRKYL